MFHLGFNHKFINGKTQNRNQKNQKNTKFEKKKNVEIESNKMRAKTNKIGPKTRPNIKVGLRPVP